ncbi:hypothetical protein BJV82DRAFT_584654 [Fennellomyces sp. T-0311]|nr:hypothetical protein BJV82DRAFT_584654 [Fennellomyces sp. T-0311]
MNVSQVLSNGRFSVYFHQLSFLTTGVCSTLGVQWLFYTGAASGSSFFTQLTGCVGSMLAGLIIPRLLARPTISATPEVATAVTEKEDEALDGFAVINLHGSKEEREICAVNGSVKHLAVARLAILDMTASSFVTVGFSLIGSGMYQVIFSSVVVWAAILSYLFMRRELSISQWVSICGTSAGLTLCAADSMGLHEESNNGGTSFGTALTLGGTFLYACVYVYGDHILSQQKPPPPPLRLCFYNGLYTTLITLIYIALYTMPRLDQLIHIDPLVPGRTILGMYLLVTVINATHSWNYYQLLESTGSVATGILQAIRAILVYAISHFWYCSTDSAQCFTVNKGCGSLLVIGCVLLFTLGKKRNK